MDLVWSYLEAAWALLKALGKAMELKSWIEVILSVVIGGATLTIALQQYWLARRREDRDLWDRQIAICETVYRFLDVTSSTARLDPTALKELNEATEPLRLQILFDESIRISLSKIRTRAHELRTTLAMEEVMPPDAGQQQFTFKRVEIIEWMEHQRAEFKEKIQGQLAIRPRTRRRHS